MNNCEKCGHHMRFHYLCGVPMQCDHEDDPSRDEQCGCTQSLEMLIREVDAEIDGIEDVVNRTVAPWRDEDWSERYGN